MKKMNKAPSKYTTLAISSALGALILVYFVWLGVLGYHAFQLLRLASRATALLGESQAQLDAASAAGLIHEGAHHLSALEANLRPVYPATRLVANFPWVGPYAGQMQPLLQYAVGLAQAGDAMLQSLQPVWGEPVADLPPDASMSERLFYALSQGEATQAQAAQGLEMVARVRQQIDPDLLPGRASSLFRQVDDNFALIQAGTALLPLLPDLMGGEQAATYLVVAQNREELRPTGGFITGIGLVRLEKGRGSDFSLGDSYSIDDFSKPYPLPPEPIQRLMLGGVWVTRDANWSPDFPTAARQVQELYTLSTGTETQGVIAFDQAAVSAILDALGPIQLPDTPEAISAANLEFYMQQAWAPAPGEGVTPEWWLHRKDFMVSLGNAILERVFQTRDPGTLLKLARNILYSLRAGHLLIYFNQAGVQEAIAQAGFDHSLNPGAGDFLMVVDANIGFNKTDSLITRSVEYQVDLTQPEHPRAKVLLNYQHGAEAEVACVHQASYGEGTYQDLRARCYWDYWRVYTPPGSRLLEAQVKPVPGEQLLSREPWPGEVEIYPGEGGTQVFAGVMVLPTRQSEHITLAYKLPAKVISLDATGSLRYTLRIQKQAGVASLPLRLSLHLPPGYRLAESGNGWEQAAPATWSWSQTVEEDLTFELTFLLETGP
ncbi:MAG: DUF4012 domain-containing protein [Anaerolineales bacterium]|nr:DUF4012 domain-containing protein [Anaerolineales bacterium]